ncbi:MAG: DUF4232 domain-containing protein [Acidimicrobiales bacterium]
MKLTLRPTAWLAVGAALACAAIVFPTSTIASASSTGRAAVPRCTATSLGVWVGPSSGAAGTVADEFGFTNHSAGTCSLYGYPAVQMLKSSGANLATFDDQAAPGAFNIREKAVFLTRGESAYFGVVYGSQTGFANLTCPTSAALRFTPPQAVGALTLRGAHARISPYSGTIEHLKCGVVHVTPVTAKRFQ